MEQKPIIDAMEIAKSLDNAINKNGDILDSNGKIQVYERVYPMIYCRVGSKKSTGNGNASDAMLPLATPPQIPISNKHLQEYIEQVHKMAACKPDGNPGNNIETSAPPHNVVPQSPVVNLEDFITALPKTRKAVGEHGKGNVAQVLPANTIRPRKPNASKIARELVYNIPFKIFKEGIYVHIDGYYQPMTTASIRRLLNGFLRSAAEAHGIAGFYDMVADFIKCDGALVVTEAAFEQLKGLLAFRNGVLDVWTGEFFPHNPRQWFFTHCMNIDYNPHKVETPCFDAYLDTVTMGDPFLKCRIWEAVGYIISNDLSARVLFLLQGLTRSGKSTLVKILDILFPPEVTTALAVMDMDRNFAVGELLGKALCCDTELPDAPLKTGAVAKLKQLTSADLITTDVKFQSRARFINRAKLVLCTNHPLQLTRPDDAFLDRIVTIPFLRTIPREESDVDIVGKFIPELLGIVQQALFHYRVLVTNKYSFSGHFPLNSMFAAAPSAFQILNNRDNAIHAFLETRCIILPGSDEFVSTEELYVAYSNFCQEKHAIPTERKLFTTIIKQMLGDSVRPGKRVVNPSSNAQHVLHGIKIVG